MIFWLEVSEMFEKLLMFMSSCWCSMRVCGMMIEWGGENVGCFVSG